jgi:hypothetical protein
MTEASQKVGPWHSPFDDSGNKVQAEVSKGRGIAMRLTQFSVEQVSNCVMGVESTIER